MELKYAPLPTFKRVVVVFAMIISVKVENVF